MTVFTNQDVWFGFKEKGEVVIYFCENSLELSLEDTKHLLEEICINLEAKPGITLTTIDGTPIGKPELLKIVTEFIDHISQTYCPKCEKKKADCECRKGVKLDD